MAFEMIFGTKFAIHTYILYCILCYEAQQRRKTNVLSTMHTYMWTIFMQRTHVRAAQITRFYTLYQITGGFELHDIFFELNFIWFYLCFEIHTWNRSFIQLIWFVYQFVYTVGKLDHFFFSHFIKTRATISQYPAQLIQFRIYGMSFSNVKRMKKKMGTREVTVWRWKKATANARK